MLPDWWFSGNARDESDTPRDGFLSSSPEIHAVAIGIVFAVFYVLTHEPAIAVFFALLLMGKAKLNSGHLKDAAKETAYSGGAFVAVWVLLDLLPPLLP